ncbi:hypothetical protein PHYPSEUDO_005102 [Phytophthora pseudosyringae]|uniref:Myb-like DNA-binding protein n=1 Tax=Phytophthora pseudosyringae TaxID=221518 RepID=A0A8T1VQI7_9STRA|nr:hypothetical protein PHYPSEUDO_005102 [Phytophthora pseudosyringae]
MLKPASSIERGLWSGEEHDRFLDGLKLYPHGPWKKIAGFVGTRSPRQVQTHAQKYYEKVGRRLRGLRKDRKKLVRPEHRLDEDMVQLCRLARKDLDGRVDPSLAGRLRAPLSSPSNISISLLAMESSAEQQRKSFQDELQQASSSTSSPPPSPTASVATDSDTAVDLSDFDDSCLDFLIEVLGGLDASSGDHEDAVINV